MKTKLFTLFLSLVASVGTIFAESGTCGDNLTWDLTDGVLTISGTGAMYDYIEGNPWSQKDITSVVINTGVTSIGTVAFSNCTKLTSVTIPNSVTSIGFVAFNNCSSLTSIEIPNSVTSIGYNAFYRCTSLTSVTIPNSVTSIGYDAFSGCTNLVSVYISDLAAWCAINFEDNGSNPLCYAHSLYLNEELLTKLVIPNSVTSIGNYAFRGCTSLTSIEIPNNVTSIGNWAFSLCSSLKSVTIPNSVTSIGEGAFSGCTNLASIKIPNSVTNFDVTAISRCNNLTSVMAPACIFEIQEKSWVEYTHSLQYVTFYGGELTYNVLGVLSRSYKTLTSLDISAVSNAELDDEAFKGFYNLHTLVLPAGLTKIGYMSVAECVELERIDIPVSVTEIDARAFENCRSLTTITFGGQASNAPGRINAPSSASQLQIIGNWAFYNCHELQNLTIPEGVTYIGDGAFYGCVYMEDLSLPASVQTIGDNTFALCVKLQKIVVNAPVPPSIQAKTFFDVKRQIPVYVPDESVNAYKNDAQWGEFNIQGASQMPQAIENNQLDYNFSKILRDGQILILRGDKTYTMTGQEVK